MVEAERQYCKEHGKGTGALIGNLRAKGKGLASVAERRQRAETAKKTQAGAGLPAIPAAG